MLLSFNLPKTALEIESFIAHLKFVGIHTNAASINKILLGISATHSPVKILWVWTEVLYCCSLNKIQADTILIFHALTYQRQNNQNVCAVVSKEKWKRKCLHNPFFLALVLTLWKNPQYKILPRGCREKKIGVTQKKDSTARLWESIRAHITAAPAISVTWPKEEILKLFSFSKIQHRNYYTLRTAVNLHIKFKS